MEIKKDISYLGKDFGNFRKNLIDFSKQYFPDTYTDFNESSPGMLFIELASYVGDVLSYYADNNLKESIITQATERGNIYNIANSLGYNPKTSTPAHTTLDIYQLIPAMGTGDNVRPNYDYALSIKPGMIVDGAGASFRTTENVNFNASSSANPTEVTVYESDDTTLLPIYYLLKKQVKAVSGKVVTETFDFGTPKPYDKVVLSKSNVIEILSVTESDGDPWTQVPYLAQDTVFEQVPNLLENDPDWYQYRSSSPYLLKLRKTAKRFITSLRSNNTTVLQFGAGISDNNDEEIVPNPTNVGNALEGLSQNLNLNVDPSNFMNTRAYGQAPSNTTLTITYTTGVGVSDNVDANVLTDISTIRYEDDVNSTINVSLLRFLKSSVSVNNPNPATGATSVNTLQSLKNDTLANFATQNRLVTRDDYIIRTYSMPAKFGSVSKAYIVPDDQLSQNKFTTDRVPNPLAMNLYTLGMNSVGQLTQLNGAVKNNLKNYLNYYRMLTDAINIKDAFIINIGIDFEIIVKPNYNSNEVLLSCINELKNYFNVDNWQINQPIVTHDIMNLLGNVAGVQTVVGALIKNLYDNVTLNYSGNIYDIGGATKNSIIYPALDPSIFEVKFPNTDIKGRVISH